MVLMGFPSDSNFSGASTYNSSQPNFPQSKEALKPETRGFFGSLISCFIPSKAGKQANQEDHTSQANDSSNFSASRSSTISSNSQSKVFRFSGSSSLSDTGQGRIEFSIADIYKATGNYSTENIIGQGGFGTVYKGKLKDGSLIAVKRAKKNMYQNLSLEFKSETQILSKIEHLNLVRFLGCLENHDERIIVVEYVGNGNLREHLDGMHGDVLELGARLDIAIDIAHAVTYLHMYAEKFRAKVADFGFARLAAEDPDATHISTQVKGTAGYLDPEYLRTYQLTEKSDVYSFGVLLVELVTGRRPIESNRNLKERVTIRWAMQKLKEGEVVLAMDLRLRRSPASIIVVERLLRLAAECLASSRRSRPSMKKCAEVLCGVRKDFRDMQRQQHS